MTGVRDKSMAVCRPPPPDRSRRPGSGGSDFDRPACRRKTECDHFNRQRKTPEQGHPFAFICNYYHADGCSRHDLLVTQRTTTALDEAQIGGDFIGAVDCQVKDRHVIKGDERAPQAVRLAARRLRGCYADDVKSSANTLAQQLEELGAGRAGAETHVHRWPDQVQRSGGGLTFVRVHVHHGI